MDNKLQELRHNRKVLYVHHNLGTMKAWDIVEPFVYTVADCVSKLADVAVLYAVVLLPKCRTDGEMTGRYEVSKLKRSFRFNTPPRGTLTRLRISL